MDASPTGIGGVWGEMVYAVPVGYLAGLPSAALFTSRWSTPLSRSASGSRDWPAGRWSFTVTMLRWSALNSGRAHDQFLLKVARNIWLITAVHDIQLQVCHIPGKRNLIADTLSRWLSGRIDVPTAHKFAALHWCQVQSEDCGRHHIGLLPMDGKTHGKLLSPVLGLPLAWSGRKAVDVSAVDRHHYSPIQVW